MASTEYEDELCARLTVLRPRTSCCVCGATKEEGSENLRCSNCERIYCIFCTSMMHLHVSDGCWMKFCDACQLSALCLEAERRAAL
jgi:hypothetical protein